ncbi:MAG TPA: hypothetical protein VMU51_19265 [Mycobacteriales bacterium]|nr:hypothetical protein [Mycobacteriales bacterium]
MRRSRGAESGPHGTSGGIADSRPEPPADSHPAPPPEPAVEGPDLAAERRTELLDLTGWLLLAGLGLGLTLLAVGLGARLGTAAAPFAGRYHLIVNPASLLAPTVAVLVLLAVANGIPDRLGWPVLQLTGYAGTAAWTLALVAVDGGTGLTHGLAGAGYLAELPRVGDDPGGYLTGFAAHAADSPATRDHPPLPVLLLWAAGRLGLHRPVLLGVAVTLVGALVTPLVAAAVRSLCGEPAARRLLPVLVLAPYAPWVAVNVDAVTAALGAAFIAVATVGSRPGRPGPARLLWASLCGLLLGLSALYSYAVIWLAATVLCVYFVRRRPLLNVATGMFALLPLVAAESLGFSWPEGLAGSRRNLAGWAGAPGSALVWTLLGLVVLVLAAGPALVASARKVRLTPGWPFLVGGVLSVAWTIAAGLTHGEAERAWLPFFPWLLIGAVAPAHRGGPPPRPQLLLLAAGAATAICLQAILRSPW